MATTTIKTRIKNRFDTLTNWQGTGVTLLPGEIALVSVTTQQIDKDTGDVVNVPAVLMKVGESDGKGGTKAFNDLPWVSALAADVYDWAKKQYANDVPVTIKVGDTDTAGTLGGWLKSINDKASQNAADISANTAALVTLNKSDTENGSIAYKIKAAIDALDFADTGATTDTTTATKSNFVTVVTQTDGKIAVTKKEIKEIDLPNISSDKITIGSGTTEGTLSKKLSTMDAAIASKADAHNHNDYVNQNAFSNIKVGTTTVAADTTTDTVEFVGSNITITGTDSTGGTADKITFSVADASDTVAGVVKLGVKDGAATYNSIYGTDGKGGINAQVEANKADIANLKTSVAGGVHFIGTVTAVPTSTTIKVGEHTVIVGDVVIYKGTNDSDYKEYICTAATAATATWEQLGDVTRIGALETKINNLDFHTNTNDQNVVATTHKFVSEVTQTDGKITATYARPTASDIAYGTDSDVNTKLGSIDAALANKSNEGHTHPIYENQNAFSKIAVSGQTTVEADTATDTVTFAGSNVTITTNKTSDTVTFSVATATAGEKATAEAVATTGTKGVVALMDSVYSNSKTEAATANAVKTAYDKGAEGVAAAAAIAENYLKVTNNELADQAGNVIIFDCGGAA